jgi:hypothetical protein
MLTICNEISLRSDSNEDNAHPLIYCCYLQEKDAPYSKPYWYTDYRHALNDQRWGAPMIRLHKSGQTIRTL